jgi:hypothetical protein
MSYFGLYLGRLVYNTAGLGQVAGGDESSGSIKRGEFLD